MPLRNPIRKSQYAGTIALLLLACTNSCTTHSSHPAAPALRLVNDTREFRPLLITALTQTDHESLLQASAQSALFNSQSPANEIIQQITRSDSSPAAKADQILNAFNVYKSIGNDGQGTVQFTGYYATE